MKRTSRWKGAQDLDILDIMLKDRVAHPVEIQMLRKGCRKKRESKPPEPELEALLVKEFEEARQAGRSVNRRSSIRHGQEIYS